MAGKANFLTILCMCMLAGKIEQVEFWGINGSKVIFIVIKGPFLSLDLSLTSSKYAKQRKEQGGTGLANRGLANHCSQ